MPKPTSAAGPSTSRLMLLVAPTLAIAATIAPVVPADAQEVRRACRATGHFVFTFKETVDGSTTTRTKRIDILQSDMEVVANSAGQMWSTATDAKRWACAQAAQCFVQQAAGAPHCGGSPLNAVFETIRKPEPIDAWRRNVACNHARAGSVPGLRRTGANAVILTHTKIVATAHRDGITRNADTTVDESGHACWSASPPDGSGSPGTRPVPGTRPTPARPQPKPVRTDPGRQPSRTDASHQPARTDASHAPGRTNGPSPIAAIKVNVTPPEQRGTCPASVLMQVRLELRRPTEVRWWVTGEDGYRSPKYVRNIATPDASLIWRRHIDPKPTTGGLSQAPGGTPRAPIHRGYFQVHFETAPGPGRAIPLGASDKVSFTVDCNPAPHGRPER